MILQALVTQHERLKKQDLLGQDEGFSKQEVHFRISIDEDGKFLALIPQMNEKGRGKKERIPTLPKRSSGVSPGFLVDKAPYVLGLGLDATRRDGGKKEEKARKRNLQCNQAFSDLLQDAGSNVAEPSLQAMQKFYDQIKENRLKILAQRADEEWTGTEFLAFDVAGLHPGMVHEAPKVKEYWQQLRAGRDEGEAVRCLVTGKMAAPARLHPNIKRVPGAQTSGASLVSFNADAFTSHGLEQGANAAVSRAAADAYTKALNYMLEGTETRRHRAGVSHRGVDAVTVLWTESGNEKIAVDIFALLEKSEEGTAEDALRALESPLRGIDRSDELANENIFALTLGGNAARVVVRDWFTVTREALAKNLRAWFADLELAPAPKEPLSIATLEAALQPPGKNAAIPPDLCERFFRSALLGERFPDLALQHALRRFSLPPDPRTRYLEHARVALIKAALLRRSSPSRSSSRSSSPSPSQKAHLPSSDSPHSPAETITVALDPTCEKKPYLLGRVFAALEYLQGTALGDVNASIRDRYFGAASATPAYVFPRLLRMSVHHEAKAKKGKNAALAHRGSVALREAMNMLPPEDFPSSLLLPEQGLFAIGYWHQRQDFFTKKTPAPLSPSLNIDGAAADSEPNDD